MEAVKYLNADISEAFLAKLISAFPMQQAFWKSGDDVAEAAYKAGQQNIIEWIKNHASVSSYRP